MMQKTLPHAILDRQELTLTLDGEELPYFYAEAGPRVEELAEGLSIVWVPIIVGGVEEIEAETPLNPHRSPDLWPESRPMGGRALTSYRGDS
jgi:hypothetical protein